MQNGQCNIPVTSCLSWLQGIFCSIFECGDGVMVLLRGWLAEWGPGVRLMLRCTTKAAAYNSLTRNQFIGLTSIAHCYQERASREIGHVKHNFQLTVSFQVFRGLFQEPPPLDTVP